MKRHFLILVLSFYSWLVSGQTSKTNITLTPAQWQEDVKYFGEQLVKKHKNAFHHVSKEEFEKDIERLNNDIPSLKDYQVIIRLLQITATTEYKEALGTRLSKTGDWTLEEVKKRLASVLSQDENKWFDKSNVPGYLSIPEVLVTLDIVPDIDHAHFTFFVLAGSSPLHNSGGCLIGVFHQLAETPMYERLANEISLNPSTFTPQTIVVTLRKCST